MVRKVGYDAIVMIAASDLLDDLSRLPVSEESSARVIGRLADLLLGPGQTCGRETLEAFDVALDHFVAAAARSTRAELAGRLADAGAVPPNILLTLAFDDIAVAFPILARSRGLADPDLMALAATHGRAHLLAICERPLLSEPVTEVLVGRADVAVSCAVADNLGARLSPAAVSLLVEQARTDDRLGDGLGARPDLSAAQVQDLVEAIRERERERLRAALSGARGALEGGEAGAERHRASAPTPHAVSAQSVAHARVAVERLASLGRLDENQLTAFAREGRHAEAMAAFSIMTGLPMPYVSGLFGQSDNDVLLAIARSLDWSWDTCATLLRLRNPQLDVGHRLWRAREMFTGMPLSTAQQALRFVQAGHARPRERDPARPGFTHA